MRSRRIARCLLAAGALALACGGDEDPKPSGAPMARGDALPAEERGENEPPVVERVVLQPQRPLPGGHVEARIDASDPEGDPIRLSLEWRHDGRVIASGAKTTVAPERLRKGDEVQVLVTATDGRDESEPVRAVVTVGNQAPLIQALYLTPDGEVRPGQEVTAAPQGKDADGDRLEYEFEWHLNDQVVRDASEAAFDTSSLKRGDRLQAHVRVTDGEDWSPVAESMVLELANRPPMIAGVPPIEAVAGGIHADLEAQDPDGDKGLRFRVIEGPKGLSVDAVTGRVSWRPGAGVVGAHPVEIAVADTFGAESALRFELTVSAGGDDAEPPPAKRAAPRDAAADDESEDDESEDEELEGEELEE
jgi:Putative Ig domain